MDSVPIRRPGNQSDDQEHQGVEQGGTNRRRAGSPVDHSGRDSSGTPLEDVSGRPVRGGCRGEAA